MGDRPEVLRRRQIKHILDSVLVQPNVRCWIPEVLTVWPITSDTHQGPTRAIQFIFSDRIFTMRLPSGMISKKAAGRILLRRPGFGWSQTFERAAHADPALCKDYLQTETREAASDLAWIMCRILRLSPATPVRYRMGNDPEVATSRAL